MDRVRSPRFPSPECPPVPDAADVEFLPADEPAPGPATWKEERENLLELLAQQQRVAQAGLMTAGLAHDVNNHLQVLSGVAYLGLASEHPREWRAALETVQQQCLDLAELTTAFVDFVRRREGDATRAFRAADAVRSAVRLLAPLARHRGVTLRAEVESDALVAGEQRLVIQALVNLVSNAIRACAEGSGEVVLRSSVPCPGTCRLQVLDNGGGIPEAIRAKLFRPFVTGSEDQGGTGLGLFLVRQCVRRLKGLIRVRTSPQGTCFTIDLPARDPA